MKDLANDAASCYLSHMTKLLEQAIARARELPEAEQDAAARMLLGALDRREDELYLDERVRAAIDEGLEQALRGEFAADAEIAALWTRHGL